ncbi:MAG: hypothetical protein WCC73_19465, partial [Terracidiphilus sp.]
MDWLVTRCENSCGDGGLAVTQPAIAGTHRAMLKNLKAFVFEPRAQQPRETPIVQAAARKSHFFNSCILVGQFRCADKCRRNSGMKTRGDERLADA